MTTRCRFLIEAVLADADFLPEGLRNVLRDFAYAYMPHLHVAAIICRRGGGEVTVTLAYEDEKCLECIKPRAAF